MLFALVLFTSCSSEEMSGEEEQADPDTTTNEVGEDSTEIGEDSSELKIAINAQPPSMDPQMTTATATRDVARLVFESLLVLNEDFEPVPFLAEKVDVENNQTFTFH